MNDESLKTYFALSDIHGRSISIHDFEAKGFEIQNENHIIVLLGDYFDRGTENSLVLRFLEKYKALLNDRFIMLRGNHDEFIHKFITYLEGHTEPFGKIHTNTKDLAHWLRNGGQTTLTQLFGPYRGKYLAQKQENVARLKRFYQTLEDYYETKDYIFTHAAINEERIIDTWDRDFFYHGMKTDKTVIIGHTTHPYLINPVVFLKHGHGVVAQALTKTLCPVLNIDNGKGNNITIFKEKPLP